MAEAAGTGLGLVSGRSMAAWLGRLGLGPHQNNISKIYNVKQHNKSCKAKSEQRSPDLLLLILLKLHKNGPPRLLSEKNYATLSFVYLVECRFSSDALTRPRLLP
jgi:hypothetical protein